MKSEMCACGGSQCPCCNTNPPMSLSEEKILTRIFELEQSLKEMIIHVCKLDAKIDSLQMK